MWLSMKMSSWGRSEALHISTTMMAPVTAAIRIPIPSSRATPMPSRPIMPVTHDPGERSALGAVHESLHEPSDSTDLGLACRAAPPSRREAVSLPRARRARLGVWPPFSESAVLSPVWLASSHGTVPATRSAARAVYSARPYGEQRTTSGRSDSPVRRSRFPRAAACSSPQSERPTSMPRAGMSMESRWPASQGDCGQR